MADRIQRDCTTCGGPRAFEAPACADGHGGDCPDLACLDCGEAVFVGILAGQLAASGSPHRGRAGGRPKVASAA